MKKIFLSLSLAIGIVSQAQLTYEGFEGGDTEYVFTKRTNNIKLGVGLPSAKDTYKFADYKVKSQSLVFHFGIERGALDFGKGFVMGYGGGISIQQLTLEADESQRIPGLLLYPTDNPSNIIFTGYLGAGLHKSFNDKFETYANFSVGANFLNIGDHFTENKFGDMIKFRPSLGLRYKFYKSLGVFAEVATGRENFRAGISFF